MVLPINDEVLLVEEYGDHQANAGSTERIVALSLDSLSRLALGW